MSKILSLLLLLASTSDAFTVAPIRRPLIGSVMRMSTEGGEPSEPAIADAPSVAVIDDSSLSAMDAEMKRQEDAVTRSDELRSQEVFMKKSTGKHRCTNCNYEYDETEGDIGTIGGMIQPGTAFAELPSNWRCPTCRAQKGAFEEIVTEIPGFEVNQGYGFGGNSMSGDQKNLLIFGGLFAFFVLFLGGYGMS